MNDKSFEKYLNVQKSSFIVGIFSLYQNKDVFPYSYFDKIHEIIKSIEFYTVDYISYR